MKPLRPPKSTLRGLPARAGGPRSRRPGRRAARRRTSSARSAFSWLAATVPYLRRHRARPGHGEHEVVRELVEAPLDAEVGAEREREDVRVGREVAARVVADQQHRALLGDVLEAANVGAEVEAREHPEAGQRLADVVGVALVEVGRRGRRRWASAAIAPISRAAMPAAEPRRRRWPARGAGRAAVRTEPLRRGRGAHGRRSLRPLVSRRAWRSGPARRRPGRAADLVRLAGRQAAEELPDRRAPELLRHRRSAVSITCVAALRCSSGCGPSRRGPRRWAGSARPRRRSARTLRSSRSSRPREARRVSEGMKSRAPLTAGRRPVSPPPALARRRVVSGLRQITRSSPRPASRSRLEAEQTPPST